MRATVLPYASILTRPIVSINAKGCTVAGILPLRCFLFLLPNYTNILMYF